MEEASAPDLSTCRFHQNLQLLQCTIEAKRRAEIGEICVPKRRRQHSSGTSFYSFIDYFFDSHFNKIADEEDFFDAQEELDSTGSIEYQPDGRLRPSGSLCLLHYPDRRMYEPITQSRAPITEDMLEKHTAYLSSLETVEDRIRAQLEPLFSDMEAFKFLFQIFNDFENFTVSNLIISILPILIKLAASQLLEESKLYFPVVGDRLLSFCKKAANCTRTGNLEDYLDAVKDMMLIESTIASCNMLYTQLIATNNKVFSFE
ncbi:unnamed protein product [Gongylonema pulchrum]|uniref:Rab3 GTPase-activating protein catalytic subunit n=1 Tax=Gongylonema pulchrum TaxID=637853 RepID=A0A183D0R2_9BILA|nr:unnamed protein product [Gongylonema pulchrum]